MTWRYAAIVRHVLTALVAIGILVLPAEGKLIFAALFLADFCYRTDAKLDEILTVCSLEQRVTDLEKGKVE